MTAPSNNKEVWRYLAEDFLQLACLLTEEERDCLIAALAASPREAESIHAVSGFMLEKTLVAVCEEKAPEEVWLFFPREKRVKKLGVS